MEVLVSIETQSPSWRSATDNNDNETSPELLIFRGADKPTSIAAVTDSLL